MAWIPLPDCVAALLPCCGSGIGQPCELCDWCLNPPFCAGFGLNVTIQTVSGCNCLDGLTWWTINTWNAGAPAHSPDPTACFAMGLFEAAPDFTILFPPDCGGPTFAAIHFGLSFGTDTPAMNFLFDIYTVGATDVIAADGPGARLISLNCDPLEIVVEADVSVTAGSVPGCSGGTLRFIITE